jgi:hypothetical protein
MLRKLLTSGTKPRLIAQTMKRSIEAVQSRIYLFKSFGNGFRRNVPRWLFKADAGDRPAAGS